MSKNTVESNQKDFTFHDTVISWACIIWAIVSVIMMIYFSGLDQVTFSIMTFGQLFLIFGLVLLSRNKISGITLSITGFSCIVIPAINEWAPLFYKDAQSTSLIPIFMTVGFLMIGLAMLFVPGILENSAERKCQKEVEAECIDFKSTVLKDGVTNVYAPIYKYTVDGKEYEKCTNKFRREKLVELKSKTTLRINESKPEMVYIPASKAEKMLIYIFGFGFTVTGLGMLLVVLSEI